MQKIAQSFPLRKLPLMIWHLMMSAEDVRAGFGISGKSHEHELFIINFANPDMVGHTGDVHAARKACANSR